MPTTAGTKSTKDEYFLNLQRRFKKAVLEELVAAFPAGKSLSLLVSLVFLKTKFRRGMII
jgi:hypothetical protein